jgi:hypothetical protein
MYSRAIGLALAILLAGAASPAGYAQDKEPAPPPAASAPVNAEVKNTAKDLLEEVLRTSRAPEIFADFRRTLTSVYIPVLRDAVEGTLPGAPAPDAKTAAYMAKALTFLDYTRRAGDELDAALTENRDAIISDTAELLAKTSTVAEINDVRDVLRLPAVRKAFDAFYAMTRLATGLSYEDSRSFSQFSAWAEGLKIDFSQGIPGDGDAQSVPSPRKVAKAQAFVSDLLSISNFDEMVEEAKRFARDVYAETAPMTEEERQELRDQIDQWEFTYNLQKTMVVAIAPSVIAAALTDEQLATLHNFVRSPACARAFGLIGKFVNAATAFTKEDILNAQRSFENLEKKSKFKEKSLEERDHIGAEWDALADKWSNTLKNRISPETRNGLEKSLEDLQSSGAPI